MTGRLRCVCSCGPFIPAAGCHGSFPICCWRPRQRRMSPARVANISDTPVPLPLVADSAGIRQLTEALCAGDGGSPSRGYPGNVLYNEGHHRLLGSPPSLLVGADMRTYLFIFGLLGLIVGCSADWDR